MGWDIGSSRPINNDEEGTSNNDTQEGSILGGMCYLSSMSAGVSDGSQDGSPLNRSSAMEEGEGEGEGPDSPNTSTTLIRSLEEELRVLSKEHDLAESLKLLPFQNKSYAEKYIPMREEYERHVKRLLTKLTSSNFFRMSSIC